MNNWIETKTEMPPFDADVLVTYETSSTGNQVTVMRYVSNKYCKKPKPHFEWNGRRSPWEVIAWQIFPEPFHG